MVVPVLGPTSGLRCWATTTTRHNLAAFASPVPDDAEAFDAIISNSAGCGAALREYGDWLPDAEAAAELAGRLRDVCAFLDEVGCVEPPLPAAGGVVLGVARTVAWTASASARASRNVRAGSVRSR